MDSEYGFIPTLAKVQLYNRDKIGSVTRLVRELKSFEKIELKKGEKKTVAFEISVEDLKFYNSR